MPADALGPLLHAVEDRDAQPHPCPSVLMAGESELTSRMAQMSCLDEDLDKYGPDYF